MTAKRIPSGMSSTLVLAGVTWLRLVRGRALWVSLLIAALPCLYAVMMRGPDGSRAITDELYAFEILVLAILAPMFISSSLGEEIEDRTTTYLWSRPIPRWAVLAGKLLALVPIVIAIACASWLAAANIAWSMMPPARSFLALALGATGIAMIATGIATIAPKHGMALTICYLLFFDLPIGVLPATLQEMSVTHQLRTLSGLWPIDGTFVEGLVGLTIIAAVWAALAIVRIRRLEA